MAGSDGEAGGGDKLSGLRAVLFDAGNTLIYMPRGPAEILQQLCEELGVPVTPLSAREAYRQSEAYYVQNYLGYAGEPGEFWLRYYGEALCYLGIEDPAGSKAAHLSIGFARPGIWQAYPEALAVCRSLRARGLRLGVISNGPLAVADLLSEHGLLPLFDAVVISQAVGIEKPDPRIFALALERLGVSPGEALYVGDLYEVDVLGARSAGLAGVLIDRYGWSEGLDCPVVRSLEELV